MRMATFDIETNGLLPQADTVWCGAIKEHDTGNVRAYGPDSIDDMLVALSSYDVLVGHNCIDFDFPALKKIKNWEYKGQVLDTLVVSRLQRPNRRNPAGYNGKAPHSVEAWGHRVGVHKIEHEDWTQYSEEMLQRCIGDAEVQYNIYLELLKEGEGKNYDNAIKLTCKIFQYLTTQAARGFTLDQAHTSSSVDMLNHWIYRIDGALRDRLPYLVDKLEQKKGNGYGYLSKPFKKDGSHAAAATKFFGNDVVSVGGPFSRIWIRRLDLDSTIETKNFLLDQGWVPEKWNTNADGERTSPNLSKDDPFNGIQGAMGRLVARRLQCKQRRSVLEGWQSSLRDDGRVSTGVSGIATTGRLRHKGIVNIPSPNSGAFFARQMRACWVARDGWVMVGCDSKGNQMRQLAARMDDDEFTNAVLHGNSADGTDLHSLNQRKCGAATRSLAKNFFYGSILFGAAAKRTAELLECSKERAIKLKEEYLDGMPALKATLEGLSKEWRGTARRRFDPKWNRVEYVGGYITGLDGRAIQVEYEKDLLCYCLQSDEAIHMGAAYCLVHKLAEKKGWKEDVDWGMLIWMHDEFQMECRPEIAEELGQLAADAIRIAGEFYNIKCPHDGDYMIGNNWYETH